MAVTLHYFPPRGRAEVIRLALELRGVQYEEQVVDYAAMKQDQDAFPFGQSSTATPMTAWCYSLFQAHSG